MVDAFSQYGPGPVLATVLAFALGPHTIATAETASQIANMLYFAVYICVRLHGSGRRKLPSLILGVLAILIFLAAWDYGNSSNINAAPSTLGFRYLLPLGWFSLSRACRPPARNSIYTALCTFRRRALEHRGVYIYAVTARRFHPGGDSCIRDRFHRLPRSLFVAALPVALSVCRVEHNDIAPRWDDARLRHVSQFPRSYNPVSQSFFWAYPASPIFLGWMLVLAGVFVVFADTWLRIIRARPVDLYQ